MSFSDIFRIGKIKAENESLHHQILAFQGQINNLNGQINNLQSENDFLNSELTSYKSGFEKYKSDYEELSSSVSGERQEALKTEISSLNAEKEKAQAEFNQDIERHNMQKEQMHSELESLVENYHSEKQKLEDKLLSVQIKIKAENTALKAMQKAVKLDADIDCADFDVDIQSFIKETENLHLNCLDVPALRKLLNANRANIQIVIQKYESRYTAKSNKTIYQLMVLALEAEFQNILNNLKFGTVENAKSRVAELLARYYEIASNGNQSIAPTVKRFITELEVLYLDTVNVEYEYYVQRERIKEEQRAIKEQMRQEAEERRQLAQQQKQMEKEEQKYINEIENVKAAMSCTENEEFQKLKSRLSELETLLSKVEDKKEEIINLQNGRAGHVYIISNIGSFGNNVFKVGMTRRLEPQERIDELGSASVPFPFDVHSFIFSENAVELENNLHKILDGQRVNKVNKRKEFFAIDINELERIVHKIDPSAEFKMTVLAEQYNQSLSLKGE